MILEKNHCLVTIPDLSIGNLAAVANMVHRIGGEAIITSKPTDLKNAQRIILAGVGAFDTGMRALEEKGWLEPLKKIKNEGQVPILGICFGHQILSKLLGGKVKKSKHREFGLATINKVSNSILTKNFFNKKNSILESLKNLEPKNES